MHLARGTNSSPLQLHYVSFNPFAGAVVSKGTTQLTGNFAKHRVNESYRREVAPDSLQPRCQKGTVRDFVSRALMYTYASVSLFSR